MEWRVIQYKYEKSYGMGGHSIQTAKVVLNEISFDTKVGKLYGMDFHSIQNAPNPIE